MTTRMNGMLVASVASLVLFSGPGVSAAATHQPQSHIAAASHSRASHSKSGSSHAKHKKGRKTAHKRKTTKS